MKKQKYLQIFNYLLEFSKLRNRPVRDIKSSESLYPEIVWLADIPKCEIFDCVTFSDYNQEADYWMKISKPKLQPSPPLFPKLNQVLEDWTLKESLSDEINKPVLKQTISKDGQVYQISDYPHVEIELDSYCKEKWKEDLASYKKDLATFEVLNERYEAQLKTYKRLFNIHNKAQQFGEEFELVMGFGLLNFQENFETPLVCRHIFTSKVEITFEFGQKESYIKVFPSINNDIIIETDSIIDLTEQFDSVNIIDAEKRTGEYLTERNILDNPFDGQIKEAIQIFADRIRTDGKSLDELHIPREVSKIPAIYFAPALILRKRNARNFTGLYEKIIQDIGISDEAIEIPSIDDLIGIPPPAELFQLVSGVSSAPLIDDTIYFPKKFNYEQIEIIEKSKRNSKVLVQGPPGTGKSHTIANLICHLLANGKKILVTAYTKRALEVLKEKLPEEFRHLSVSLLSGDSSSMQDLDSNVNAINNKLSSIINLKEYGESILVLEEQFRNLNEELASVTNEWLKIKEHSIRSQNINKSYQGTLTEIAERLEKDAGKFTWFKDDYVNVDINEIQEEILRFISLVDKFKKVDCTIYNLIVPQKGRLISIEKLKEYKSLTEELSSHNLAKNIFGNIICEDFNELKVLLQTIYKHLSEIESYQHIHKDQIKNAFKGSINFWDEKIAKSNKLILGLPEELLQKFDRDIEIKYPKDISLKQLKSDAEQLYELAKQGRKLRGLLSIFNNPLTPINIKQKKYFITGVKINGSDCDTSGEFETVITDIRIKQDLDELRIIWDVESEVSSERYLDRRNFYRQHQLNTEKLIRIIREAYKIKGTIESISTIRIKGYESNSILDFIAAVSYNLLVRSEKQLKNEISIAVNHLLYESNHPISQDIVDAIEKREVAKYEKHLIEIDDYVSDKAEYDNYRGVQKRIQQYFPLLVNDILESNFPTSELNRLEFAIHFKHAWNELAKLLKEGYEQSIVNKLSFLEGRKEKLISEIASKKAWLHVLIALDKDFQLRQHLQAWVQAVKKIGKRGVGKRALKFKKEAQNQMEKCKDSIPCWIMPLYKVAETIRPEQGMYDYVIIDEASQLGADAIFLLYISKNIIIVGDDKQTSPEYIGVDANVMAPHIKRHLENIPYANFYGTEFSFFDHATRFCKGITVLREHFRCMPEIIEFSNKHFYAPEGKGLYPLKQYSENRLEPLKAVYCQNGYTEGAYQNIVNKPEAESIAVTIAELVKDKRYEGKSFGIITLQGNKQASVIDSLILKNIGEIEYQKRRIVCGNSSSFQGDERDIIFLSLVTAHNHNRAALVKSEDERRFNVAASRAKEQLWLFHSIQLEDLSNADDLRYKLLNHFINYKQQPIYHKKPFERTIRMQPEPFESWFEVDVFNDIVTNNYTVIPQYEVAKGRYRIDLVVPLSNGIKIAVECDGDKFHTAEQFQNDLLRQKTLERCGWQFFRIRGGEYYSNRKKTLEPLWELLKSNVADNVTELHEPVKTKMVVDIIERQTNDFIKPVEKDTFKINKQSELFKKESQSTIPFYEDVPRSKADRVPVRATPRDVLLFSEILVFTSLCNVYKIINRGFIDLKHVIDEIEFELGESPIYTTGTDNYSGYLIVAFKNGKIGKIDFKSYDTEQNRKKLRNAFNDEFELIFIEHIEDDLDLVAISSINKIALFNTNKINSVESRVTKGVQLLKSKDGSVMMSIKKPHEVKLKDPEFYRKEESLNVIGYYLKNGDEI